MKLPMLSADDKLAEIRRLYFTTTRQTIQQDLAKALDLLKSMATEEERERATVYMEGLAQMRRTGADARTEASQRRQKAQAEANVARSAILPRDWLGDHLLARRDAQRLRHVAIHRQRREIAFVQPRHQVHRQGHRRLRILRQARATTP